MLHRSHYPLPSPPSTKNGPTPGIKRSANPNSTPFILNIAYTNPKWNPKNGTAYFIKYSSAVIFNSYPPQPKLHRIPLMPINIPRRHRVQQLNRTLAPRDELLHRVLVVGPDVHLNPGHARERLLGNVGDEQDVPREGEHALDERGLENLVRGVGEVQGCFGEDLGEDGKAGFEIWDGGVVEGDVGHCDGRADEQG